MAHDCRPLMTHSPTYSFDEMYKLIENESEGVLSVRLSSGADGSATSGRAASGGVTDHGSHSHSTRGMRYIGFPFGNRAYECCWGNQYNHQGQIDKNGQMIGHYVGNLQRWADGFRRRPNAG